MTAAFSTDYEFLAFHTPILGNAVADTCAETLSKLATLQCAIDAALALKNDAISLSTAHTAICRWAREYEQFRNEPPSDLSARQLAICKQVNDALMAINLDVVRAMRFEWVTSDASPM